MVYYEKGKRYIKRPFGEVFPDHPDDKPTRDKCPLCGSHSLEYSKKPAFKTGGYSGILADHTPVYCASCKGRISTHGLDRDLKVDLSEVAEETGRFRDPTNPY